MQSCLSGGVATCKGIGREGSIFPLGLPVCPRPTASLWVGCLQGKPKDEQWWKGSYLWFFYVPTLCHICFGLPWIKFLTRAAHLSWTSKSCRKAHHLLQGAGVQNQVIGEHLCNSSWCHSRGWRYQTHSVSFFFLVLYLSPPASAKKLELEMVTQTSLSFLFHWLSSSVQKVLYALSCLKTFDFTGFFHWNPCTYLWLSWEVLCRHRTRLWKVCE